MIRLTRVVLGAALLGASVCVAVASPAVLLKDTAVREGPGEEFKHIWDLVAGAHVDVRECKPTQWCFVVRRDKEGWIRLDELDLYPGVDDPVGDSSSSSGGASSVGSRKGPGSTGNNFAKADDPPAEIAKTAQKLGQNSSTSSSGSSSSGGSSSGRDGAIAPSQVSIGGSSGNNATLKAPCSRC